MEYSAATRMEWALPEGTEKPDVFRQIWSGECRWDLASLPELLETYRGWLEIFPNPNDFWDGPWQNKFPVLEVGNGDMLAIDLGEQQAVSTSAMKAMTRFMGTGLEETSRITLTA